MVSSVQDNVLKPSEAVPQETKEAIESVAPIEIQPATGQNTPSDQPSNLLEQKPKPATDAKKTDSSVIDRSKTKAKLHPLNSPDTLTTIADQEEEDFITEVEAAHDEHH